MKKITKYIAIRLVALLIFPYSASAAAACHTQLDYGAEITADNAYESVAYSDETQAIDHSCHAEFGLQSI